jgi:hypothetical protein
MSKTTNEIKSAHKLFDRNTEGVRRIEIEFSQVPRKLPSDAYDVSFLETLSIVQREHLDARDPIDLVGKERLLNEMTMKGGFAASRSARGSIGDLGFGGLQGPSGSS